MRESYYMLLWLAATLVMGGLWMTGLIEARYLITGVVYQMLALTPFVLAVLARAAKRARRVPALLVVTDRRYVPKRNRAMHGV